MFRFLLRPIVLAILVTLLIWFAMVVYWQETVRVVTAEDVGIYLVGLPLMVVAIGFGLRAGYRYSRKAAPAPASAPAGETPPPATDERERDFVLALVAVGMASAAGLDAVDTCEALKAGDLRPTPDGELRNRDGFPVHASRDPNLDTREVAAALEALDASPCPAGVLRALTLLKHSLAPVLDRVAAAAPEPEKRGKSAAATPVPRLLVDLLLPAAWDERSRALAARHVGSLIAETGWPVESLKLRTIPADDSALALRQLDGFSQKANRAASADFYLLAACESAIDEEVVAALEARGLLFGSANGQGCIPGEAAAAVLTQVPGRVAPSQSPIALIGRLGLSARAKSADAAGRIDHETLRQIAQHNLAAAELPPDAISLVVSDTDQRSSRCGECVGTINGLLPDLDPVGQFIGTGQALGRLGGAGALFALGVAATAAAAEDKPVLLLTAAHPTERAAVVLRPYVEPARDERLAA